MRRSVSDGGGDIADDDVETWTLGSGARLGVDISTGERDCSLFTSDVLSLRMCQLELDEARETSSRFEG